MEDKKQAVLEALENAIGWYESNCQGEAENVQFEVENAETAEELKEALENNGLSELIDDLETVLDFLRQALDEDDDELEDMVLEEHEEEEEEE